MRTAFGSNCSATATIVSLVCLLQGPDHHQFFFDDCCDDLADDVATGPITPIAAFGLVYK